MKRFKLFIAVVIVGLQLSVLSAKQIENRNAAGVSFLLPLNASYGSIYGLDFEHWFTPKIAVGVIGAGFMNSAESYNFNVSAQFKFALIESEVINHFASRLYIFCNVGYVGWTTYRWFYIDNDHSKPFAVYERNDDFAGSAGLGLEFIIADHISLPVNFGFAGKFPVEPTIGFCLGTGLRYSF